MNPRTDNPLHQILPTINWQHRHPRTPEGTIVPFAVISITASVLAIAAALEATFGITNWISIPVALAVLAWAGDQTDIATITHDHQADLGHTEGRPPR